MALRVSCDFLRIDFDNTSVVNIPVWDMARLNEISEPRCRVFIKLIVIYRHPQSPFARDFGRASICSVVLSYTVGNVLPLFENVALRRAVSLPYILLRLEIRGSEWRTW